MQHKTLGAVTILGVAGVLQAAAPPPSPELFKSLLACRTIADSSARLACYDGKVAALDSAAAKGDVTVVDREMVKRQRKENFGRQSAKPIVPLNEKDVAEVDLVVRSVTQNGDGGWVLTMSDGSRWAQTDSTLLGRQPVSGSKAHIKKGALGSYKMNIDGGPAIKARRIG